MLDIQYPYDGYEQWKGPGWGIKIEETLGAISLDCYVEEWR